MTGTHVDQPNVVVNHGSHVAWWNSMRKAAWKSSLYGKPAA